MSHDMINIISIISIIFLCLFFMFTVTSDTVKQFTVRLIILILLLVAYIFYQVKYNSDSTPSKTNHRIEEIKAECETKIEYENSIQK